MLKKLGETLIVALHLKFFVEAIKHLGIDAALAAVWSFRILVTHARGPVRRHSDDRQITVSIREENSSDAEGRFRDRFMPYDEAVIAIWRPSWASGATERQLRFTKLYNHRISGKQKRLIFPPCIGSTARETAMTIETQTPKPQRRWWRLVLASALLLGLGGAGGFALGAYKTSAFFWHARGPWNLSAEETAARVERGVNRVLSRVDATEEQKTKVTAIAKAAAADLSRLGFRPGEGRSKFLQIFRADKVEPEAIEALRAEQSTKWDAATRRIAQAVAEAAQVLTPEQRRELTERWYRRVSS